MNEVALQADLCSSEERVARTPPVYRKVGNQQEGVSWGHVGYSRSRGNKKFVDLLLHTERGNEIKHTEGPTRLSSSLSLSLFS